MKRSLFYIILLLTCITGLVGCSNKPAIPPLDETYSVKDKNPFGTYVLHEQLSQLYLNNYVTTIRHSFVDTWKEIEDSNSLYINVSKNLFLSADELNSMLAYASAGNTLFLSSQKFDFMLLDTLHTLVDEKEVDENFEDMRYTSVKFAPGLFADSTEYRYFFIPFIKHFSKVDKDHSIVIGNNSSGPNCLLFFYGRGRIYLHSEPRALSNYFLLQKDNYNYARKLLAFTPNVPDHVYWDDYYNKRNLKPNEDGGGRSSLSVIFAYPPLKWGFYLLLLMMLVYIFFGGKRRQRIIAPLAQNINTSVAFTETVGRLYLQKKDNRNIAEKQITYFFEYLRTQYFVNPGMLNDEFIQTISRKSNLSAEATEKLFSLIKTVQQSYEVSDETLLSLNYQIEKFYKNQN